MPQGVPASGAFSFVPGLLPLHSGGQYFLVHKGRKWFDTSFGNEVTTFKSYSVDFRGREDAHVDAYRHPGSENVVTVGAEKGSLGCLLLPIPAKPCFPLLRSVFSLSVLSV